jgi:hypothetical protein
MVVEEHHDGVVDSFTKSSHESRLATSGRGGHPDR